MASQQPSHPVRPRPPPLTIRPHSQVVQIQHVPQARLIDLKRGQAKIGTSSQPVLYAQISEHPQQLVLAPPQRAHRREADDDSLIRRASLELVDSRLAEVRREAGLLTRVNNASPGRVVTRDGQRLYEGRARWDVMDVAKRLDVLAAGGG